MNQVQVLEFSYDAVNVDDIETSIDAFLNQHEIEDVKVTQWEDQLLVFFFYDE